MKIEYVGFTRASGGWICRLGFMRPAVEQCSDVLQTVDGVGVGRFPIIRALLNALAQRRIWLAAMPHIDAIRAEKGWV